MAPVTDSLLTSTCTTATTIPQVITPIQVSSSPYNTPIGGIEAALIAMGHYFDIDPKKVKLYIRQMELTGKKQ